MRGCRVTVVISTDLCCDVCGEAWVHGDRGSRTQIKEVRALAKTYGWKIRVRQDVCPKCAFDYGKVANG